MLDNVQQLNRYKETGVNILCSNYSIPYTASSHYINTSKTLISTLVAMREIVSIYTSSLIIEDIFS